MSTKPISSGNPISQIPVQKASEIPDFCTRIAAELEKQPPYKGPGSLFKGCQVLPLPSFTDARICEIFHRNALSILNNQSSGIGSFNELCNVRDSKGGLIEQGVYLEKNDEISIEDLQNLFNKVLASVQNGWVAVKAEESAHIFHQEDAKEFELFVKSTAPFLAEDTLVRFMATKFSMTEQNIVCYSSWTCKPECHSEKPYMWIRKSDFAKVVDVFGFKLTR